MVQATDRVFQAPTVLRTTRNAETGLVDTVSRLLSEAVCHEMFHELMTRVHSESRSMELMVAGRDDPSKKDECALGCQG